MWLSATQGFLLGGSLIIAIGGQNAFVIQQGVRGHHVFLVATICFLSDALLITAGTAGVGTLIATDTTLRRVAAWGGAAFLIVYGAKSAYAFIKAKTPVEDELDIDNAVNLKRIITTTLAFTYLNPHVYLDTVVLIGGIAAQYETQERVTFTIGAVIASCLWFYGLAIGARQMAPFFRSPVGARILDAIICIVMWTVAASLIMGEIVNQPA